MYHIKDAGIIPTNVEFTSDLLSQIKRLTDQALNEFTLLDVLKCIHLMKGYAITLSHLLISACYFAYLFLS